MILAGGLLVAVLGWRRGFALDQPPLLALLFVLGVFAAVALRRRWRPAALLGLATVALPFLVYEVWLTARRPLPRAGAIAARVRELRAQGVDAHPALFPAGLVALGRVRRDLRALSMPPIGSDRVLPLGGVPAATTVYCHGERGWIEYTSDRFGFRNPDAVWEGRGPSTVVLGDSFVQGFCVPDEATLPRLLAPLGSVAGLGVNGSSVLVQYALFLEYVHPRASELEQVIWLYFEGNDRRELRAETAVPELRRYLETGAAIGLADAASDVGGALRGLVDRALLDRELGMASHELVVTPATRAVLLLTAGRTQLLIAAALRQQGRFFAGWSERELDNAAGLWRAVASAAEERGAELVLVYVPSAERFRSGAARRLLEQMRDEEAAITGTWGDAGLRFVSLTDAIARDGGASWYEGLHFTERGYAAAAARIQEAIAPGGEPRTTGDGLEGTSP